MKSLVVLFALLEIITCGSILFDKSLDQQWKNYKKLFGKFGYSNEEEVYRRYVWEERVSVIGRHNLEEDLGLQSYRMGLNEYSDLSQDEIMRNLTGYRSVKTSQRNSNDWIPSSNVTVPDQVDWRVDGLVTDVKNQLVTCGACWAFSATGSLEGQHKRKTGKLVSLSEQNIIDCTIGCGGGDVNLAFDYVIKNNGIDTEKSYPYTATNGTCHFNKATVGATCTGYVKIPVGDEEVLKQAVAVIGPVSVIIDACHNSFINYKSGLFDEPKCRTDIPSHAVLIVGYGTVDGKDYWLVKNSWGESWGMEGYIMMTRNKKNQCGIASLASYPLV